MDKHEFTDKLKAKWKEKTCEDKLPQSSVYAQHIVDHADEYDVETVYMAHCHLWSLNAYELLASMLELTNALLEKKKEKINEDQASYCNS